MESRLAEVVDKTVIEEVSDSGHRTKFVFM